MTIPPNDYLESEVLGASPAKLHLLLVEGAMRAAEKARAHWHAGKDDLACLSLIRAQEIVTQMITGLDRDAAPEITGRLAAIYLFVFRTLVRANFEHSEKLLDEALRVLATERGTWRAVCDKLKQPPGDPPAPHFPAGADVTAQGFSLEA
jgi:flagellar protein FliS